MRQVGPVEIASDELAARCTACQKSLIYRRGVRLAMWKEILKAFIRKHSECGKGD